MENPEVKIVSTRSRSDSDWASLVGREVGDFEVVREIGRGGMGTVFQARQKSLDRVVALKVLARGLATTPMSVVRFQREAQAAARLHHSSIIPIHALGDHEGVYYYAMELVHGENLHDVISRERSDLEATRIQPIVTEVERASDDPEATVAIPPSGGASKSGFRSDAHLSGSRSGSAAQRTARFETIARLIASVADALDYAHQNGIIHRDVKPHNVILGEDGRIHIFDFGLARVLEQPGVTMTGEFIGSPLYMSPEQILGGQTRVDKRTDIYSLGATLYEWLTLSPPFPGDTREQVISKIITSELRLPREHNASIPLDLETICLKCLEKSPDRRYSSASEMHDDLMRYVEHEAIRARRAGPITRFRNYILRHRVAAVATMALVVAGALVAALVVQTKKSRGKEQQIARLSEVVKAKEDLAQDQESERDRLQRLLAFGEEAGGKARSELGSVLGQIFSIGTGEKAIDPFAEQVARALMGWLREEERRRIPAEVGPMEAATQDLYVRALTTEKLTELDSSVQEFTRLNSDGIRAAKLSAAACSVRQDVDCMMTHAATVMNAEPQGAGGFMLTGAAKMLAGNMSDSLDDLSRAVDLAPDSTWPLTLRAFARRRSNDMVNAIRDLSSAVRLAQSNTLAIFEKARIGAYLGDYESAIKGATRLIELDGKNVDAYVFRGECQDAVGDYVASQADYQRAIDLGGGSALVVYKLGLATSRLKDQPVDTDAADMTTESTAPGSQPATSQEASPPPRGGGGDSTNAADDDWPNGWAARPPARGANRSLRWPIALLLNCTPK